VPGYSEKVIPDREEINDLSQKKGFANLTKKIKIVMSGQKTFSAQCKYLIDRKNHDRSFWHKPRIEIR